MIKNSCDCSKNKMWFLLLLFSFSMSDLSIACLVSSCSRLPFVPRLHPHVIKTTGKTTLAEKYLWMNLFYLIPNQCLSHILRKHEVTLKHVAGKVQPHLILSPGKSLVLFLCGNFMDILVILGWFKGCFRKTKKIPNNSVSSYYDLYLQCHSSIRF